MNKGVRITVSLSAAVILIFLYSVIFSFSGQNGEESGNVSRYVSERIVGTAGVFAGERWTAGFRDSLAELLELPVRKLAHFSEYACMAVLVYVMLRPWKILDKRLFLIVVLWVFVSAAGDELHQRFVPGRCDSVWDVGIDTLGGCFGYMICRIMEKCIRRLV